MAEKNKTRKKFIDNLIVALIIGSMILVVVHQVTNVIDYTIPEPTPTRYVGGSDEYVGDGVIKDEDILEQWITPTPTSVATPSSTAAP